MNPHSILYVPPAGTKGLDNGKGDEGPPTAWRDPATNTWHEGPRWAIDPTIETNEGALLCFHHDRAVPEAGERLDYDWTEDMPAQRVLTCLTFETMLHGGQVVIVDSNNIEITRAGLIGQGTATDEMEEH